jgi:predicted Zn-dependent peptidase
MVDTGRAEQSSCHHQDFLDAGMFATPLSCDPEDAEELLGMIDEVYRAAAEKGLDRREFEQNRNKQYLAQANTLKTQIMANADPAALLNMLTVTSRSLIDAYDPVSFGHVFEKCMAGH